MNERKTDSANPYAAPSHDDDGLPKALAFSGEPDPSQPGAVRYPYLPRVRPMALAVIFFGVCFVFYALRASRNDRGLIINDVIELGPAGATAFYAVFAAISGGFVLMGGWALAVRWRGPSYLVLDTQQLSIPSRFGRQPRRVPYASIQDIQLVSIHGQAMLQIKTDQGKATVAGVMLASDAQLREIGEQLTRARSRAQTR
jgi:hypothetical protein